MINEWAINGCSLDKNRNEALGKIGRPIHRSATGCEQLIRGSLGLLENNIAVKQRIKLSLGLCVVAIAFVALKPVSAAIWECGERSNLPPEGKNYCAAGDFRQSELNMKKILDVLLAKHKEAFGDISALSNSQSAFESYRDNQCVSENKRIEDKPFHPMIVAQCKTRLTNIRIDELKRMQAQDL